MDNLSILEKLQNAPRKGVFEKLDRYKSKRMGGVKTNYIPTVEEVAKVIKAIPKGQTKTIVDLRTSLAKIGKAESACPAATLKYWKWMANLSEEFKRKYPEYNIPWWRVLKDGQPSRHMPGGTENQKLILKSEGFIVE